MLKLINDEKAERLRCYPGKVTIGIGLKPQFLHFPHHFETFLTSLQYKRSNH